MSRMKKGYTLVEILTVVVILAVLATLVLPRFTGQSERAVVAEAVSMLSAIRQAEASFFLENAGYTSDLTPAGPLDVEISGTRFTYTADVAGTASATRALSGCVGRTIVLTIDGTFSGTHPFGPNPDAGAVC